MRQFESGATRDDNAHKLNYVRGLSAQVQQRYLKYLGFHRTQEDGSLRDWDNWKLGISPEAYRESLSRHTQDAVRASMGLSVPDNATLEDLLCAVIFNAHGWLFELLVAKSGNRELESQGAEIATIKFRVCGDCAKYAGEIKSNCGPGDRIGNFADASAPIGCFVPKKGGA